jgi:hypothetical protein
MFLMGNISFKATGTTDREVGIVSFCGSGFFIDKNRTNLVEFNSI